MIELDSLGIAGQVWLSGVSGVERDGWIQPLPSPLQSVYRLDIVDDGGLILFSFVFLSAFLYWMSYSGMGRAECGGWVRVWWVGLSGTGGVEWDN